jgi:hypothetical protein
LYLFLTATNNLKSCKWIASRIKLNLIKSNFRELIKMYIKGNILNVITDEIYPGEIQIEKGRIISIKEVNKEFDDIIVPGFIDAHIHIESSMLTPSRFAEIALRHGKTSVISDPHEIANVMGMEGIEYMMQDAKLSPLHYYFSAPSCVPATKYETNGAAITSYDIETMFRKYGFVALSEVMDYESVLNNDKEMMAKLNIAIPSMNRSFLVRPFLSASHSSLDVSSLIGVLKPPAGTINLPEPLPSDCILKPICPAPLETTEAVPQSPNTKRRDLSCSFIMRDVVSPARTRTFSHAPHAIHEAAWNNP